MGINCDQKQRPCEGNPCESRGVCIEKGTSFHCRCHAWWEGPRCERKMMRIPYKPLSERMLEEPFWLGLITVTVVMGVIGLVWCAKRHFPEKIEKLLAEDSDANRSSCMYFTVYIYFIFLFFSNKIIFFSAISKNITSRTISCRWGISRNSNT